MPKFLLSHSTFFLFRPLRALTLAGSWLLLGGGVARAETPATRECIDAHANGQVARGQGGLLQARGYFLSCAVDSCPQVIRDDCAKFGAEVQAALPTVVVVARSPSGQDAPSASLKVDTSADALPVDGRAIFLDPGSHVFKVTTPDGAEGSVSVLIRDAEKDRRIVVPLAPRAATASERPRATEGRKISPLVYVFGGVGLLAAGSFTYFALDGRSRENDMKECSPACDPSDVSAMRRSYLVGDVSLGVAVASLGLGTYFLLRPPAPTQSSGVALRSVSLSTSPDLSALRVSASAAF